MRILIFFIFFLTNYCVKAQQVEWTKLITGLGITSIQNVAHDSQQNSYTIGTYKLNDTVGSFISKHSPAGVLIWQKQTNAINLNISIHQNQILISGRDLSGIFVSKYDTNGTLLSRVNHLKRQSEIIDDIYLSSNGSYFISGRFKDTLELGSHSVIVPPDGWKLFIAKFNLFDSCLWLNYSDTSSSVYTSYIKCDSEGNLNVIGNFLGTLRINDKIVTSNSMDGFIFQVNQSGLCNWLHSIGSIPAKSETVADIVVDGTDDIIITGSFASTLTIANFSISAQTENNPEIFVCKYSSTGQALWLTKANSSGICFSRGLAMHSDNSISICGQYLSTLNIGNVSLNSNANSATGWPWEGFVARISSNGHVMEAFQTDCSSIEGSSVIYSIFSAGNKTYFAGNLIGAANFDGHPLSTTKSGVFIGCYSSTVAVGMGELVYTKPSHKLFPNPAENYCTIENLNSNETVYLKIYTIEGQLIYKENFRHSGQVNINLEGKVKGVLLVEIMQCGILSTYKVLHN